MFNACQEQKPATENDAAQAETKVEMSEEDQDLLDLALAFFKPLPESAPNPDNELTPEKIELGKQLFFDPRLSKSGFISCNSCHNIASAGVDNLPTSIGHKWTLGGRNSPTVFNAALHKTQFWDGRAKDVEEQATMPILNPIEMATPHEEFAVDRIKSIPGYVASFKKVFGDAGVSYKNAALAIGAYERTLLTPAPIDQFLKGNPNAINEKQKEGMKAFIQNGCTTCHTGELMGGNSFQKFGVYSDYWEAYDVLKKDDGRFEVTGEEKDRYVFKVPSLRNILETYPYFHDGRVWDIKEAIQVMGKTQLSKEIDDETAEKIIAFFETLSGDVPAEARVLPTLPPSSLNTSHPDFN